MELKKQYGSIFVRGKGRLQTVTLDFDDGLQVDLDVSTSVCKFGDEQFTGKKIASAVKNRTKFLRCTTAACTLRRGEFGPVNGETLIHNAKILLS